MIRLVLLCVLILAGCYTPTERALRAKNAELKISQAQDQIEALEIEACERRRRHWQMRKECCRWSRQYNHSNKKTHP